MLVPFVNQELMKQLLFVFEQLISRMQEWNGLRGQT
jgi:hypothetical protein